jgi:hypothetical protein
MLPEAVGQCNLGVTFLNALINGEVGSLGFFVNMLIIGGVVRAIMSWRANNPDATIKKVVADMLQSK